VSVSTRIIRSNRRRLIIVATLVLLIVLLLVLRAIYNLGGYTDDIEGLAATL
jgi:hypothetical protein